MNDMLCKGYARPVKESYGKSWYIPRHSVFHPAKKIIRVAKYCGTLLNKELMSGPNLTNQLMEVLMRFHK